MKCWHCGRELENLIRIPFKEICPHCSSYLHCCKNCKNYKIGMPNDCLIPGTEYIASREGINYCEEFSLGKTGFQQGADPSKVLKKLFGNDNN